MPPIPFAPALKYTMDDLQEVFYQRMSPDQAAQDFYNKVKSYLDTSVNNQYGISDRETGHRVRRNGGPLLSSRVSRSLHRNRHQVAPSL